MKKTILKTMIAAVAVLGSAQAMAQQAYLGEYSVESVLVKDEGTTEIKFHENLALPMWSNCGGIVKTVVLKDHSSARDNAIQQRKLEVIMSSLETKTKVGVFIYNECIGSHPRVSSIASTNEYTPLAPNN